MRLFTKVQSICILIAALLVTACEGSFQLHLRKSTSAETDKFGLSTCVDPDPSRVKQGVSYSKCDGSTGVGTFAEISGCKEDAQVGCVSTANFQATVKSDVDPAKLRYGVTYAGVTGTKRAVKHCKNGRGRTNQGGTTTVPWNGIVNGTGTATVTNGSTTVNGTGTTFDDDYGPGDVVTIGGQSRTVVSVTSQLVMNVDTNFTVNAGPVAFTGYTPYVGNNVDDYQNSLAAYVGADATNCGAANMLNVTSVTPPLQPSGAAGWTHIYQDQLSGVYFTNVFPTLGLNEARLFCKALDGYATGGTGWHLPTVKELLQLAVNGVAQITPALAAYTRLWTTTFNTGGLYVQGIRLAPLAISTASIGDSFNFICLRE